MPTTSKFDMDQQLVGDSTITSGRHIIVIQCTYLTHSCQAAMSKTLNLNPVSKT